MTTGPRPSIAELRLSIVAPHETSPVRLTDTELTVQHAGYHDFNAIESMAVELREHRSHAALVNAAPALLEIAAAALAMFAMDVDEDSDEATTERMLSHKRSLLAALTKVRA